jgi:hypothetical protein
MGAVPQTRRRQTVKKLADAKPGEVVRLWAEVLSVDDCVAQVVLPCEEWHLALAPDVLAEEIPLDQPWPGEVARVLLADAEKRFEWALYGEDEDAA